MMADVFLYVLVGIIFLVFLTAAIAGWKAAPYVPTFQRDVRRMLKLAGVRPDELVIDLGSGDGRFLLTAAREFRARALGYEFSLLPYLVSVVRLWSSQARKNAQLKYQDFYTADLSPADVVVCFLTPKAMKKLEPKFRQELRPGTRVVSFAFRLPTWRPVSVDKPTPKSAPVFFYRVPESVLPGT